MKTNSAMSCVGLVAWLSISVQAQTTSPPPPPPASQAVTTRLEGYASHQRLSAGFENWREVGIRGTHATGAHVVQGEVATMRRFGESGLYGSVGDTYIFDPDWFGSLSVGAGDGASYLPRVRVDSFLNRKLLAAKNLVGIIGLAYYRAPDGHIDRSIGLGGTYYFQVPLVAQGEVRFNNSSPGAVHTRQHFVAATWGREKQTQVTGRYGWGTEGYQALGAGATLVNFRSRESSIAVRHWIRAGWGASAKLEHYHNPIYDRRGVTLGLFLDLP